MSDITISKKLWNIMNKELDTRGDYIQELLAALKQQSFNSEHNLSIDQKVADKIEALEAENQVLKDWKEETLFYIPNIDKKKNDYKKEICRLNIENNKLKRLLLLTDDSVSDVVMNELTMRQWKEFIRCFPEHKEVESE